jgi:hypothetical protein
MLLVVGRRYGSCLVGDDELAGLQLVIEDPGDDDHVGLPGPAADRGEPVS